MQYRAFQINCQCLHNEVRVSRPVRFAVQPLQFSFVMIFVYTKLLIVDYANFGNVKILLFDFYVIMCLFHSYFANSKKLSCSRFCSHSETYFDRM
jgi:hypothetical protein